MLHPAGVFSSTSYVARATGVSASEMVLMWRQVARTVPRLRPHMCLTCLFATFPTTTRRQPDPSIERLRLQVLEWFSFCFSDEALRALVRRAWEAEHAAISASDPAVRRHLVRGPMRAIISLMLELSWNVSYL